MSWLTAQPQSIKGSIQNAHSTAVPSALIISSDSDSLYYSDENGKFEIPSTGERRFLKISAPGLVPKKIVLPYNFKEEVLIYLDSISAKEDFNPYEIIRRARYQKDENRDSYTFYRAKVFNQTRAYIHKVPFNIWMVSGLILPSKRDTGLAYLSEQVSLQEYRNPKNFKDSLLSFHAAGTLPLPDLLYLSDKNLHLYQEKISIPEIGPERFYTPLSSKALHLYDFEPLGTYYDGERKVYSIGFKPKKYGTPALQGTLAIYDSVFTLASVSFTLTPAAHLKKLDSIKVSQSFYYRDTNYHQATQHMKFYLAVNGFRGSYSSKSFYTHHQYIRSTTDETHLEVLKSDSSDVSDSTEYWQTQRPLSLNTTEEQLFSKENLNGLFKERFSRVLYPTQDFKPYRLLYRPYVYRSTPKHYLFFDPVYHAFGYNSVEGFYMRYDVPVKLYQENTEWTLRPEIRYGFADGGFKSRLTALFTYDLSNPKKVKIEAGHVLDQFNNSDPISPFINTLYSLFLSRNYLKLYGKDYLEATYQMEVVNGLEFQSSLEFASRYPVYNNSDFVITGTNQGFTSNNPERTEDINQNGFSDHQALTFRAHLAYRFNQLYKTINGRKINLKMNTPRMYLDYRQGIKTEISETHYSFIAGGISFNTTAGKAGFTKWDLSAGSFFDVQNIEFIDYQHFNGTQTFYLQPSHYYYQPIKQFSTLGYYDYSTKKAFAEAHVEHHFNGFLLSRTGLMRRTQAHTYLGANYLNNFTQQQFLELFIGFDNINNIMRVEVAGGIDNFTTFTPTFLVGLDFDLLYYVKNHQK